ncbi:MAG TPA: S9 family peptidase [Acidobacteriota bacterium]|nr:S9 family peptidase [Acidobacteriota bacterium]
MLRRFLAVMICVYFFLSLGWAETDRRPMTVDDIFKLTGVVSPLISPDGQWILYGQRKVDWKENEYKTTYWRIPTEGGQAYRFIGEEGGSGFAFSPQGTYLAFLREAGEGKNKKRQIFIMRTQGGEAVQLSKHETSVGRFQWSEDESRIFFQAEDARPKDEKEEMEKGADSIMVDEGPNGQRRDFWNNLWVIGVEDEKEEQITDERHLIGSWDVSADGSRIVYTARSENRRNQQNLSEIYLHSIQDGLRTQLTDNRAPESGVQFAPDGKRVLYVAPDDQEWELRNRKIWVMDVDSKEYRMVSGQFEGNLSDVEWSPDGRHIYFSGLQRTDDAVFRLDAESGGLEKLLDVEGAVQSVSYSADRSRIAYVHEDHDTPEELYSADLSQGSAQPLTELNAWVTEELLLSDMQVTRWNSSDGLEIEGLVHLPPSYQQGRKTPLILHIHGGPAGVFTNSFSPQVHIFGGLGYALLQPNVRGSSGYDDELLRGNMRDIGGGDYQDLMTGVDHVIEQGIADPERLGVRGWSYGGILGGWTITQTDRFKGASLGAMVSDWTSEYGPGFNHDVRLWYIGGTPWENPEAWRQKSSLTHIADVTTPTILFHGMNDRTDTESQSMMYFAALKDRGVDVRYIRFPREGHGIREPRHFRTLVVEEVRWMQKYVVGDADWQAWERPQEKEEKQEEKSPEVR